MPIPVFFICFIVFAFWFRVKCNQSAKNSTWNEAYWQKENTANFARKKDISDLEYLKITSRELPLETACTAEETPIKEDLMKILQQPILNLSGMSNADVKLAYGIANFERLSACDQNYTRLIRTLNQWGVCCFQQENITKARQILEYAIDIGSDISATYLTLAQIYLQSDEPGQIQTLIQRIDQTDSPMKESIKTKLTQLIQQY